MYRIEEAESQDASSGGANVRIPLLGIGILTRSHELVLGQCQVGSLTGAVASQVTGAKGYLSTVGNRDGARQKVA